MKRILNHISLRSLHICSKHFDKVVSSEKFVIQDYNPTTTVDLVPISKYGGEVVVTLVNGTSLIGKQGAKYIQNLVGYTKVPVTFENVVIGDDSEGKDSDHIPHEDLYALLRNRTAIFVDLELDLTEREKRLQLVRQFDLHTCIVKMKSHPSMGSKFDDLDIWTFRQNNLGDYSKLEYEPQQGVVETLLITAEPVLVQYLNLVFQYVSKYNRKKITFAHQAHHFPKSEGLFRELAFAIHADQFKSLEINEMSINELVLNLIKEPQQFDVICTLANYGDMINSLLSGICGGAGLFSSVDLGEYFAVFKPLQTKLSLSECRTLAPYGIVKACIDLLTYLDKMECADLMRDELEYVMCSGIKTEEFGGDNTSDFVICSIVNKLQCHFT